MRQVASQDVLFGSVTCVSLYVQGFLYTVSEATEHHVTVVSCDSCKKHDEITCLPAAPATHRDEKKNKQQADHAVS